jgi:single-strand DNA-binding protein
LQVDEIGPSLRYATAKVQKADRERISEQTGLRSDSVSDPWGSAPSDPPF